MENKTPKSKKAIQTRQRLLEATFAQIAEHGYHNITVDKIAQAAGVSTGSAYRYFQNKKEMLLATIHYYFENIQEFSQTEDSRLQKFETLDDMLSYALEQFYVLHKKYYAIHEELESLRHIDPDIKAAYHEITEKAIDHLLDQCPPAYASLPHLKERIYLAVSILEHYSHMQMEDSLEGFDQTVMKSLTIQAVMSLGLTGKGA